MVVGERFVWGHFGKTGGDSVHEMFGVISRHVIYKDAIHMPEKHVNFYKNEERLGYDLTHLRKRIMNIRRLPSWMLSFANHKYRSNSVPIMKEALLTGTVLFEKDGDDSAENGVGVGYREVKVDVMLEEFMCDRIDYWLRTEYLAEDFIRVMSEFVLISAFEREKISRIRINVSLDYNKDIAVNFSPGELELIYRHCPIWAKIEKQTYGNILTKGCGE